ncbi:MAG: HAD-IC family P-type ATPase [Candidatus Saccharimonadales bacterium]
MPIKPDNRESEDTHINSNELWHNKAAEKVVVDLGSNSDSGLSNDEVKLRLDHYGPNKLPEAKPDTLIKIFFRQFKSPLIYLLLAAGVVVLLLDEFIDAGIIFFVLLFNAVAGTIQAGRAQNTLQALRKFAKTQASVIRGGKEMIISDEEVAPGDIILLQEGEKIPADARILLSHNLRVSEAALTGESDPIGKFSDSIDNPKAGTADQRNMLFKGSHVVAGTGKAVVVATGLDTVIGKISEEMSEIESEVPLQSDIKYLSRIIIVVVLSISAIIFSLGFFVGQFDTTEIFMLAVAVVVSAIPEGLPIVMTLLLATGVWRMSKRNVLVKRLQAVEALGEAQVIAVDKTGTITRNELIVEYVYTNSTMFSVTGSGYEIDGDILLDDEAIDIDEHPEIKTLAQIGGFCSNARLSFDEESEIWKVAGDPTEAAMEVLAEKIGFSKYDLHEKYPQTDEIPFDAKLKYHAVVHEVNNTQFLAVAGAPEVILAKCSRISEGGNLRDITDQDRQEITEQFSSMSKRALRVIALAKKQTVIDELNTDSIDQLTFVGLLGMKDDIRQEVATAMVDAKDAGIRVVMITGDHRITAEAIAKEVGIFRDGDTVLTDEDIEDLSDEGLAERLDKVTVFARITPEHKFRIVSAYKLRGEIVAMTGDGVNDALSLVSADLGVAMGKSGTEVAKEASDLILLDDNFGSIISAVEEGRSIYKNIKKVLLYLFSTSLGELMIIIAAILLGYPLPVLAAQLLWLNLVTDGFLDAALAMEKKEPGLLKEKFVKPKKWIIDGYMTQRMLLMSTAMAITTLVLFSSYIDGDYVKATTIALTTMVVFQWYKVITCRSEHKSIFQMDPFSNKYLVVALAIVITLHIGALYTPVGQFLLRVEPLSLRDWAIILVASLSTIVVDELRKWAYRRSKAKAAVA